MQAQPTTTTSLLLLLLASIGAIRAGGAEIETPRVADPRLKLELFAAEPEIVTPTGTGVDPDGNLLVIESHTHFRPEGYKGPPADRILRFEDTDGDGRADRVSTFYEGSTSTMSVAGHPNGWTYVATRDDIFRLKDTTGDGVANQLEPLVHLESADKYPHSALAGFAFADDGEIYFGLGENHAMPFTLTGSDGRKLRDIEGGHVYRMHPDGSQIQRVSIGCWNPHSLAIDDAGRLFAVDNDPDSLPPCRLLHVVPGADFGYKYRNGRKGTHPFTAWNGELADTLPMVAGTGEAPSGMLVCGRRGASDRLPSDFRGDLLVTSWGDHRIERYVLKPRGASVEGERTDLVVGGENFRPVGIVAGGDGAIYISDWVDKSYTLHNKGRIWRLSWNDAGKASAESSDSASEPADKPDRPLSLSNAEQRAARLRACSDPDEAETLWQAARDDDPFIRQAAWEGLRRSGVVNAKTSLEGRDARQRLAVLCVLRALGGADAKSRLGEFLADADAENRLVALKWIGEARIASQRASLDRVLTAGPITPRLFAAYLATIEKLDRPPRKDNQEWSGEQYAAEALRDDSLPIEVRRWALRTLRPDHPDVTSKRMDQWLNSGDDTLRLEAVRTLRASALDDREARLWQIAEDAALPIALRCEAIVGLSPISPDATAKLLALAQHGDPLLAAEALRSLRGAKLDADARSRLQAIAEQQDSLADLVARVVEPDRPLETPPPSDIDAWLALLEGPADAEAGERIFFHAQTARCAACHQVNGRGGVVGPDLTTAAKQLDRRRLIESILQPSKEISPQYTTWTIIEANGVPHTGVLLSQNTDQGTETYGDTNGKVLVLKTDDIDLRKASDQSIMPPQLEKLLTPQEFRDLLAFLQSEK